MRSAAGRFADSVGAAGVLSDLIAIGGFSVAYLGITTCARVPEAAAFTRRLRRQSPLNQEGPQDGQVFETPRGVSMIGNCLMLE